jgi:hypothetical protein
MPERGPCDFRNFSLGVDFCTCALGATSRSVKTLRGPERGGTPGVKAIAIFAKQTSGTATLTMNRSFMVTPSVWVGDGLNVGKAHRYCALKQRSVPRPRLVQGNQWKVRSAPAQRELSLNQLYLGLSAANDLGLDGPVLALRDIARRRTTRSQTRRSGHEPNLRTRPIPFWQIVPARIPQRRREVFQALLQIRSRSAAATPAPPWR